MDLKDLRLRLRIFSRLKTDYADEDCKLAISGETVRLDPPSKLQGFFRFLHGDNRTATVHFIAQTYKAAETWVHNLKNNAYLNMDKHSEFQRKEAEDVLTQLKNLQTDLRDSVAGVERLQQTYQDTPEIVEKLNILIQDVQRLILAMANVIETRTHAIKSRCIRKVLKRTL